LHYVHQVDGKTFELDTKQIKAELDGIPLSHPQVRNWLQDFIAQGEKELR
jgi:hypothetical protein